MDTRFQHLLAIERSTRIPGLCGATRALVQQFIEEVRRRTHLRCAFNKLTGSLFFYYPRPEGDVRGVRSWPLVRSDGSLRPVWRDVDVICRSILSARAAARLKDADVAAMEKQQKAEGKEANRRMFEDMRPDVEADLERRKNRRGMGRNYRPSALVNQTSPVAPGA